MCIKQEGTCRLTLHWYWKEVLLSAKHRHVFNTKVLETPPFEMTTADWALKPNLVQAFLRLDELESQLSDVQL